MKIFIRVDASVEIGIGHVIRCLTLAEKYRELGNDVIFICRILVGDCIKLIENRNFQVLKLPSIDQNLWEYTTKNWQLDAKQTIKLVENRIVDLLIVDHYSLDEKWHKKLAEIATKIMVVDDLANRKYYCNYLVDHNDYLNLNKRYINLIPDFCETLLGPKYAILRQEFSFQKKYIKKRNGTVENVLVSFGGSDPTNETQKVLKALRFFQDLKVHVVVGSSNQNAKLIKEYCDKFDNFNYYYQIRNMAELINKCDIGIGAGGVSTWERCSLGLPSLVVATAENQFELSETAYNKGIINYIGLASSISIQNWKDQIASFVTNKKELCEIEKKSVEVIDCLGAERIVMKILSKWSD